MPDGTLPEFDFGDIAAIPHSDRITLKKSKLLGCSRVTLWKYWRRGVRINGQPFRLPAAHGPERFTTAEAHEWWLRQITRMMNGT